jgi:pimeloyl-ACP methyl ester carboxylesterase
MPIDLRDPAPPPRDPGWGHGHGPGTEGVRLHYVRSGRGPAAVLVHGWPGFWYDWRHVIPRLTGRLDVIAVDLRGFGGSDPAPGDPYAGYDESILAADVLALLDHLGVERFALAGHDVGSAVAPARLAGERATGLALFNPTHPQIGDRRYTRAAQRELWHHGFHAQPWSHRVAGRDPETIGIYVRHFLEHWTGRRESLVPAEVEAVVEAFTQPGVLESSFGWYRSREATRDRRAAVPALELPTFVVWGDSDPVTPLAWREGLEATYPRARVEVAPGVGHFVPIEAPDAAAEAIAAAAGG